MEDLYQVLGLGKNASQSEIKTAYKKQALKCHPDRALPEKREQATTQFKLIAKAYEVLSNPSSKNQYDHSFNSSGPFHSSPFSYDDNYARTRSTASSPDDRSQFFGSSPQGPFSFTWESAADSARRAKQNARSANTNRAGFGFNNPFELFEDMFRNEMNGMGMGSGFGFGSSSASGRSMFEDPFMSNHSKMSEMGMGMGGMPSMSNGFANRGGRGGSMMEDLQSNFESPQTTSASTSNSFFGSPSSFSAMPPAHGRRQQQSGGITSSFSSSSHSSSGGGPIYSSSSTSTSTSTYGFGVNSSSESRQTRVVNGRQETIIKKVDEQGEETVHVITPETQSVFVNGVQQAEHPY